MAARRRSGRIVKLMGDGVLAEFASVVDAVECSLDIQRATSTRDANVAVAEQIVFRIGVNLGDVIVDGEDIYGEGVNIAARLEGLAEPGGICISGDVQRQVKGKIEAAFEDIGEQRVKNITEPLRAYRVMPDKMATPPSPELLALPDKPSIAVLPFDNLSRDADQGFFADGIAEDIITELSKFRSLFVIARNSVMMSPTRRRSPFCPSTI